MLLTQGQTLNIFVLPRNVLWSEEPLRQIPQRAMAPRPSGQHVCSRSSMMSAVKTSVQPASGDTVSPRYPQLLRT